MFNTKQDIAAPMIPYLIVKNINNGLDIIKSF